MTNPEHVNKKCRKCGSPHLKVYVDSSGYCLDCNDTFANINEYKQQIDVKAGNQDAIVGGNYNPSIANKKKSTNNHETPFTYIFLISGLGFLVLGIWNIILSLMLSVFPPHYIITFIVCGCLFILSGMSIYDCNFKRAFYFLIVIFILLFFQGIIIIYLASIELDALCICPIIFLIFILISAFLLLRLDKGARK